MNNISATNFTSANSQMRVYEEGYDRINTTGSGANHGNPYHNENMRKNVKNSNPRKSSEATELNSYLNVRPGRQNFSGSNSIGGLLSENHALNQSVDHAKPVHSQSQNYPLNFAPGVENNGASQP